MVYKTFATILLTLGIFSLISAGTLPALASPLCDGSVVEPGLECEAAHATVRGIGLQVDLTCSSNGTICYQAIDSECGNISGFQLVIKGRCVGSLDTSTNASCEEDAFSTFVAVDHFITDCVFEGTDCLCAYLKSNDHPTQFSEVCDCGGI